MTFHSMFGFVFLQREIREIVVAIAYFVGGEILSLKSEVSESVGRNN